MLAAPDIDAAVFRQQMVRLGGGAHVSILVAGNDRALGLSSLLANDRMRVGALDPKNPADRVMIEQLGVTVRDLSDTDGGFIGHSTYANAPGVIAAIGAQLGAPRADDRQVQAVLDARGDLPVVAAPLPVAPPATTPRAGAERRPGGRHGRAGLAAAAGPLTSLKYEPGRRLCERSEATQPSGAEDGAYRRKSDGEMDRRAPLAMTATGTARGQPEWTSSATSPARRGCAPRSGRPCGTR